jgi:hypothetical protein
MDALDEVPEIVEPIAPPEVVAPEPVPEPIKPEPIAPPEIVASPEIIEPRAPEMQSRTVEESKAILKNVLESEEYKKAMRHVGSMFNDNFIKYTPLIEGDYKSKADEYRAKADAHLKKLFKDAEITIRVAIGNKMEVNDETILKILDGGRFKSQFETSESKGTYDNEYRAKEENRMFGYNKDMEPVGRPIYGYAADKAGTDRESSLDSYGAIKVVLKSDVRDRATVLTDDSLGTKGAQPTPIKDPTLHSFSDHVNRSVLKSKDLETLNSVYNEVQIHGGVTVKDIARIQIPENDKNERFAKAVLERAVKLGIEVEFYDRPYGAKKTEITKV